MRLRNRLLKGFITFAALAALTLPLGAATGVINFVPSFEPGFRLVDGGKLNQMLSNINVYRITNAVDTNIPRSNALQAAFQPAALTTFGTKVAASTAYRFDLNYIIVNTGTNSHTWAVAFGGTATITSGGMTCEGVSTTSAAVAADSMGWTSTLGSAFVVTTASTSATENAMIHCFGRVNINAAGTWIPQIQSSADTGVAALMKIGSYYEMTAIGPSSTIAVGPWS